MTTEFGRGLMPTSASVAGRCELYMFGGPYLVIDGRRHELPEGGKRLIAFLALAGRRVERRVVAGALWPMVVNERAAGNLRSVLWRLRGAGLDVVASDNNAIQLAEGTVIDLQLMFDWATRLIEGRATDTDLAMGTWRLNPLELLPGWYDDWVVFERERLRQRVLHGLEALSRLLVTEQRYAEAVEAAMAVVTADPLRESAQRLLVEAHLAEGNVSEARRSFETYSELVYQELLVPPGAELAALLGASSRPTPQPPAADRHPGSRSPSTRRADQLAAPRSGCAARRFPA